MKGLTVILYIGKRISFLRKEKNLDRLSVYKGIVSSSHFSNIESGRFEPSEETLSHLSDRLNVPRYYLTKHKILDPILERFLYKFKKSIEKETGDSDEILKDLNELYPYIPSIIQEICYLILLTQYYFKKGKNSDAIDILNNKLSFFIDESNVINLPVEYLSPYYYIKGVYYYFKNNYLTSYIYFEKQSRISDPDIKGQVNYNISLTYWKRGDIKNALIYAKSALESYLREHKWRLACDAYNLIGVLYWEIEEIGKAEDFLKRGLELARQMELYLLESRFYHNLGLVENAKGNLDQSIAYLKQSLENKKETNAQNITVTIRSLIEIFLDHNLIEKAKELLLELDQNFDNNNEEYYHLKILNARINLLDGNIEFFEKNMIESILYFEYSGIWREYIKHTKLLCDYYESTRQYKKANNYLKKMAEAYCKINGGER